MTKNALFAASLAVFSASPALAAPTITSAAVTGPSGTVWDTTANSFYTLFLQQPFGNNLNPNDEAISSTVEEDGATDYTLAGDGFPTNMKMGNSDPFYTLTLVLTEGAQTETFSGTYVPLTGIFTALSGPTAFSSGTYALTDFAWYRSLSNVVGSYSVDSAVYAGQSIGSKSDYLGAFTVMATAAVPEPATWGMMIVGFGAVGATLRRRSTKVAFAV